ncbi:ornithine carbamoyltransferase [Metallumcola ferriviriculae]|uniref:Ornithine carbamoyltransferase n=1 Tax=Metallumcola ferriviriculae TaxID=3039180 RepID=A0AAU0UJB2_9FIRM|nr:ornithine carbamoyltransferase [Desulfitibacteraceae bacterium MK1]
MQPVDIELRGRDFLNLNDFSAQEIDYLLNLADKLKQSQKKGEPHQILKGKSLAMIFHKNSTRTRVSFEVGMYQLGGQALFLGQDLQLGRGESVVDTAKVLSRYVQGIMIRTFSHQQVEQLAREADVPVINGLTDLLHPCQVMADLMTIKENKGTLSGLKMTYIGDGNNMAHSLIHGCTKMGMEIRVACPGGYEPEESIIEGVKNNEGKVIVTHDVREAAQGVDVLYTDVWASMGQEREQKERQRAFSGYQINKALLSLAKADAVVMHCLPAHRGEEITTEVIDGPRSVIFDQAENRLHVQKAVMASVM